MWGVDSSVNKENNIYQNDFEAFWSSLTQIYTNIGIEGMLI